MQGYRRPSGKQGERGTQDSNLESPVLETEPSAEAADAALQWGQLNNVRHALTAMALTGALAALSQAREDTAPARRERGRHRRSASLAVSPSGSGNSP